MESTQKTEQAVHVTPASKKNNTVMIVVIVLAVLFLFCVICSVVGVMVFKASSRTIRNEVNRIEEQVKEDVNKKDPSDPKEVSPTPTDKANEGDSKPETGTELPSNFPKDFPLYPGSKVGYASSDKQKGELAISFDVEVSNQKVIEFYKSELSKNGWTILQEITLIGRSYAASKGDQKASVIILGDETATTYVVTIEGLK